MFRITFFLLGISTDLYSQDNQTVRIERLPSGEVKYKKVNVDRLHSPKKYSAPVVPSWPKHELLGLTDQQQAELDKIFLQNMDTRRKMLNEKNRMLKVARAEARGQISKEDFEAQTAEYRQIRKKLGDELFKKTNDVLIPYQQKLVEKHRFEKTVQDYGLATTLTDSKYAKQLAVDRSQKKEIAEVLMDTDKDLIQAVNEFEARIAKINKEKTSKLIKVLNASQRKKLNEIHDNVPAIEKTNF